MLIFLMSPEPGWPAAESEGVFSIGVQTNPLGGVSAEAGTSRGECCLQVGGDHLIRYGSRFEIIAAFWRLQKHTYLPDG